MSEWIKRHGIFFLFLTCSILTLIYPCLFLTEILDRDWPYFNSLSLIVRSNILTYHTFPLHDPWKCGGLNLLANPQNRIFSPFSIFDLFFIPQWANLLSLMAYAFFGLWGMYRLLRFFDISSALSIIGAILFINSSWFGLHYGEGHIVFGSFQLLPWVLWAFLQIEKRHMQLFLSALLALFLLDGGIYPFVFSLLLMLSTLLLGLKNPIHILKGCKDSGLWILASMGVFVTLSLPKTLPTLLELYHRPPRLDITVMPIITLLRSLFFPLQTPAGVTETPFGFHEFGCYLGLLTCISTVLLMIQNKKQWKLNFQLLFLILFWLWISTGWLPPLNPWRFLHTLPFLNQTHVQSRFLIIAFLFYLILACVQFNQLNLNKKRIQIFLGFILLESFVVRNYPFYLYHNRVKTWVTHQLIAHNNLDQTVEAVDKSFLYLPKNMGSKVCYEPTRVGNAVLPFTDKNYKGEIYLESKTATNHVIKMTSYTPGKIYLEGHISPNDTIVLNTTDLGHWHIDSANALITSKKGERLKLQVTKESTWIYITFLPWYLPYLFASWFLGIMGLALLARRTRVIPK